MKIIKIEPTKSKPGILLDDQKEVIKFSGMSLPENALQFYLPVLEWIKEYLANCQGKNNLTQPLKVSFSLSYYNTASQRAFLDIFKLLKKIKDCGKNMSIDWNYEKDDISMFESGKELSEIVGIELNYIEEEESQNYKSNL